MALPSIATFFSWDLPTTNVVLSEEETSHSPLVISEKSLPDVLNVHDFLKFLDFTKIQRSISAVDHSIHLSIFLSIFSPPPEY